jgi:nickel/cobalt exporter
MVRLARAKPRPGDAITVDVLTEIAANADLLQGALPVLPGGLWALFSEAGAWLVVAFALGLVHAFDADHVMALSVLATDEQSGRRGVRAGLRWSVGHGVVLLCVGVSLFGLGRALPAELSATAERVVGLVMVALGIYVWRDLARRRAHVHFHEHDGIGPHAHWHSHPGARSHPRGDRHHHEHAASMVGALHGLAGSAPILALLPAAARSPGLAMAYLIVFGLGVALAMALVSGALGHFAGRLSRNAQGAALSSLRAMSATGSIGLGAWLILHP